MLAGRPDQVIAQHVGQLYRLQHYYYDMNGFKGVFKSFSDAPRGAAEELEEINWGVGAEYTYDRRFFLRAGYHHEHENKGGRSFFSFGAGIALNVFHRRELCAEREPDHSHRSDTALHFGL